MMGSHLVLYRIREFDVDDDDDEQHLCDGQMVLWLATTFEVACAQLIDGDVDPE